MDTHLSIDNNNLLKTKTISVSKYYNTKDKQQITLHSSIKDINNNQKALVMLEDHGVIKDNSSIYLYINDIDIHGNPVNIQEFSIVIDDVFSINFDIGYDNIQHKYIIKVMNNYNLEGANILSSIPAGKYILKIMIDEKIYYSYIEIEKKIDCSTWKNMVNYLEKEINGLAYSIAWKKQGLSLDKNSSDTKSINKQLYPLYLIETYSETLISVLTDLNEKPKHKVEKIYTQTINGKNCNKDIVTIRKNARNPMINLYKFTYNKQITYDIEENRILKKIIKFINGELISIVKLLKRNINITTEKFKKRYLKYLSSAQKLINIINIIQYSDWYNEVSDTTSGFIPHSLVLDSRYGSLYKIYNELLNPIEGVNFNSNFYQLTKTSNLIYELWCYIAICKLFENDEEYEVTKDFFSQYENEIYPDLKENTKFVVENKEVSLHISYNKTIKSITDKDLNNKDINENRTGNDLKIMILDNEYIKNYLTKELDLEKISKDSKIYKEVKNIKNYSNENTISNEIIPPFYTVGYNNQPDIIIDIYSKESEYYVGSIIVECKYRAFNNYWYNEEKRQKGTCNHQINSYSNDTRVNPFIDNHYFNLDIDLRPVKKVFVLSPNIKNNPDNLPKNPVKVSSIIHLKFEQEEDVEEEQIDKIEFRDNNVYKYIAEQIEYMTLKHLEIDAIFNNNKNKEEINSEISVKNNELEKKIFELEYEIERIKNLNSSVCNEFESLEEAKEYCEIYTKLLNIEDEFEYTYYEVRYRVWVIYIDKLLKKNIENLTIPDFVYGLNVYRNGVKPLKGSGKNSYTIFDFSETLLIEQTSLKSIKLGKGIRDLTCLFWNCKISKELCENIATWDVSNIISFRNTFNTGNRKSLDLSKWENNNKLIDVDYMLGKDKNKNIEGDNIPEKWIKKIPSRSL